MDILLVIAAMIVIGLIVGFVAGLIWKEDRPIGVKGDYVVAVITAVLTGLLDYVIIPAMGFSQTIALVGLIFEPPLIALFVLWLIRKAKS